jgi:RNA polymerase sigma factor (sigma-70 family)
MTQGPRTEEGREDLLASWHRLYRRPLLRFFERRTRPDVDREDLVQEVFGRLAKRDDLANVDNVEGYLFQTASSVLTDWARRRTVRAGDAHVPLDDEIEDTAVSPERVLLGREAIEQLGRALAELPERTQTIFALYHFEEVPQRDIAQRLGCSLSTVEKEMSRANHHILKRLGRT